MPRLSAISPRILSFLIVPLVLCGTSCRKKAELQYQTEQLRLTLADQQMVLKRLQAESAAVGNLGKYNQPQREHLTELKNKMEGLKKESVRLKAECEAQRAVVDRIQSELDSYLSQYAGN